VTVSVDTGSVEGVARLTVAGDRSRADTLADIGVALADVEADDRIRVVLLALPDGLRSVPDDGRPIDLTVLLRWRNLRKLTIAAVSGTVSTLALAVAWTCDLIVAAEGTEFVDLDGAESVPVLLAHAHELGPRRAKQLMLTGGRLSAAEAVEIGMVTKMFPADTFEAANVAFAERVAGLPSVTGLLIKDSVNQAVDNMGYENAVRHAAAIWHQAGLDGSEHR